MDIKIETFTPKVGQYFRISHKGTDKSWLGDIFICKAVDDGFVACKLVSGLHRILTKTINFVSEEWNFYPVSDDVIAANELERE